MIFFKNKEKRMFATDAQIEDIKEGTGAATGHKASVLLTYMFNGAPRTEYVNFWNSKDTKKAQNYTRVRELPIGSYIAVLIANNGKENTALAFAVENEFLKCEQTVAFFGRVLNIQSDYVQGHHILNLGFRAENPGLEIKWQAFVFEKTAEEANLQKGNLVLVTGKSPEERLSPKGTSIMTYLGEGLAKIEENPVKEKVSEQDDITITLGVYGNHPVKLSKILAVPNKDKPRVMAWLHYVADEWQPQANMPELKAQKDAIIKMLASITA